MSQTGGYPNHINKFIDGIEGSLDILNNKDFSTSTKQTDGSQKTQIVGGDGSVSTVLNTGELRVSNKSYLFNISQGHIPNHEAFFALGYNPDVDNVFEDIVEQSINYIFPPAGGIQMNLVSTSANDNGISLGTGIRTVHIHYLDNNLNEFMEVLTLNGLTPVLTTATNIYRIQKMHTITAGSLGVADGNIILYNIGNTINYAQITAGGNYSRNGIFTVPAGKVGYITGWGISAGAITANHNCIFSLKTTSDHSGSLTPGIFQEKKVTQMVDGSRFIPFECPVKITTGTDVKVTCKSDGGSANVIATSYFEGWLENA